MQVRALGLDGVYEIIPARFGDARGFFSETWKRSALAEHGIDLDFVQDNHSLSAAVGTLRGIHYQAPPMAQDKLVRCTRGRVFDVAVDLRTGSPTRGQWVSLILDAATGNQILVPKGFAHGFQTFEDLDRAFAVVAAGRGGGLLAFARVLDVCAHVWDLSQGPNPLAGWPRVRKNGFGCGLAGIRCASASRRT